MSDGDNQLFDDGFKIKAYTYRYIKGIFRAILKFSYTVRSYGLRNLDEISNTQGFLMAANHHSIVDAFVMGLEVQSHKIRFVGRQRTLWSNPIFGKINSVIGTIPVPERRFKNKSIVIDVSVAALKNGAAVGIFPEGAILNKRKKFEGKTGTIRMALEAGVPVVPAGLLGTDGLWPYGAKMPRLGRHVKMFVGEPLYFDDYHGMQDNYEVVRYVNDLMMREIRELSGWYGLPAKQIVKMYEHYKDLEKPDI